jgi:hypothetical protein
VQSQLAGLPLTQGGGKRPSLLGLRSQPLRQPQARPFLPFNLAIMAMTWKEFKLHNPAATSSSPARDRRNYSEKRICAGARTGLSLLTLPWRQSFSVLLMNSPIAHQLRTDAGIPAAGEPPRQAAARSYPTKAEANSQN